MSDAIREAYEEYAMKHNEKIQRIREIRDQLALAEEKLMTADSSTARWEAGNEYDRLTAELEDLRAFKPADSI
jgi:coenzyme F420-reducing hydrogenase delta subunit